MLFFKEKQPARKGLNIIIVGCGKVGASITEQLYMEGHDVTVVDRSSKRVQNLTDQFDVMGIIGNGASYKTLSEAGIDTADLIVAVTDSDELNLLCCTVAKRVRDCAAIARVRTPEYTEEVSYLKEKLGLALVINPEQEAGREILRILSLPAALNVNPFAHGRAEMVTFKIPSGNRLDGKKLIDLGREITRDILVCAVERENEIYIPDGNFALRQGDEVSFIATVKSANRFFDSIGIDNRPVKDVLIIGGGRAAYYLGSELMEMGIDTKIIERNRERCEELSVLLPEAIIINGNGSNDEVLKEEGITKVDAVVPLTGIDEENILLTLYAKENSDAKVITKIEGNIFRNIVDKLDLGSVIYPRYIVSEAIIAYVRAFSASVDSNVETLFHIFDSRAEAVEFRVSASSHVTDIPLKDLKLKSNLLIACISRGDSIIIPGGMDSIQTGDTVMIVTTHTGFQNLDDILR